METIAVLTQFLEVLENYPFAAMALVALVAPGARKPPRD
jgi:hypothetical protein